MLSKYLKTFHFKNVVCVLTALNSITSELLNLKLRYNLFKSER